MKNPDQRSQSMPAINPKLPPELAERLAWVPDGARNMGIHVVAGKGAGKSRMLGRLIAWQDFIRGVPLVVIDPHGPTIDNFLDKLTRLPKPLQKRLWRRVRYIDMAGGEGHVVPFPLFYRLGEESLYTIASRYLEVVRKLDPYLQTASVEGFNALATIGRYAGMVLSALSYQITEAEDLLRHHERWESRLAALAREVPEVQEAAGFFTEEFGRWSEGMRTSRTDAFLGKTALFRLDPVARAMFGANEPGIDWSEVVRDGLAVLIDFRGEHNLEATRFKLLWVYTYLLEYIKARGWGRHKPISLIIDEITYLLQLGGLGYNPLEADLDELINRISRQYMVWLTLAHQELYQVSEGVARHLIGMGTQVFGLTTDPAAARVVATRFCRYRPYWVKKYEPMYATSFGVSEVIDYRSVEFTPEEQQLINAYQLLDLPKYHFLVASSPREGAVGTKLRPVSIAGIDQGLYVNEGLVGRARALLARRQGRPVSEVLAEIKARRPEEVASPRAQRTVRASKGRVA